MPYRRTFTAILTCILLISLSPSVFASTSAPSDKRIIALAVHLDIPKQDWPGLNSLNDKIIETFVTKLNTVVVNQVISGSGVMEKLKEFGVDSLESVEAGRLTDYGRKNNISYIIMFSLRASDFSYSLKAFDVAKGSFLYDGASQSAPAKASSWSLSDLTLSPTQLFMKRIVPALDEQLTALLKLIN